MRELPLLVANLAMPRICTGSNDLRARNYSLLVAGVVISFCARVRALNSAKVPRECSLEDNFSGFNPIRMIITVNLSLHHTRELRSSYIPPIPTTGECGTRSFPDGAQK